MEKPESNNLEEVDQLTKAEHRLAGETIRDYEEFRAYYNDENKLHRLDGPAVEWHHGPHEWWLNGFNMSEEEYLVMSKKYGS